MYATDGENKKSLEVIAGGMIGLTGIAGTAFGIDNAMDIASVVGEYSDFAKTAWDYTRVVASSVFSGTMLGIFGFGTYFTYLAATQKFKPAEELNKIMEGMGKMKANLVVTECYEMLSIYVAITMGASTVGFYEDLPSFTSSIFPVKEALVGFTLVYTALAVRTDILRRKVKRHIDKHGSALKEA